MFYKELNSYYDKNRKARCYYQASIIETDSYYNQSKYRYDIYYSLHAPEKMNNDYQKDVRPMITFFANEYDENFIKFLIDYYEPVTHMAPPPFNYSYSDPGLYGYYSQSVLIDDFIRDHKSKDYNIEAFVTLLIHIDMDYTNFSSKLDIKNLLHTYNKLFNVPNKQEVIEEAPIRYTRPLLCDLTVNEALLFRSLKINVKRLGKDTVRFIDKIYEIMSVDDSLLDDTVLIKDYEKGQKYKKDNPSPTTKLPLKTNVFNRYVNNITIGDLKKIYGKIAVTVNGKAAIMISEDILKDNYAQSDYTVSIDEVLDNVDNMVTMLENSDDYDKNTHHNYYMRTIKNYINKNVNKDSDKYIVTLINSYITYTKDYDIDDLLIIYYSFCRDRETWITNSKTANYIIEKLFMKIGIEDTYNIIMEVIKSDFSLTAEQWMNYINNVDDYKDMPIAWWSSLVK